MDTIQTAAKTETLGKKSLDLLEKTKNDSYDAVELQREMQKDYLNELIKTAKGVDWEEPFYVCVQLRKERHLQNVLRSQFYARKTRPAPDYDLTLFSYDPKTENLKYEWTIPDPDSCLWIMHNKDKLPQEEQQLAHFVELFSEGRLF